MKNLVLLLSFMLATGISAQTSNPQYDSTLAKSLGADDYGMKSYILVILKTGPANITNQSELDSIFIGHLDNIQRLANLGKLIVAGPFGRNEESFRGIFILNVKTREEAQALLETDPAVREKVFETELYEWYGSAALGEYLKVHAKIEKNSY